MGPVVLRSRRGLNGAGASFGVVWGAWLNRSGVRKAVGWVQENLFLGCIACGRLLLFEGKLSCVMVEEGEGGTVVQVCYAVVQYTHRIIVTAVNLKNYY